LVDTINVIRTKGKRFIVLILKEEKGEMEVLAKTEIILKQDEKLFFSRMFKIHSR